MNPAAELVFSLSRFANRCRQARWFGALTYVGVAQDIAADIVQNQNHIRATAHAAETYDLEALAKIGEAQHPDSDGGRDVTPKEMRAIKPLITKSAVLDHDTSDSANVDRA